MYPKLSVLMPVYNGDRNGYLEQSVESMLNQSFKDFEFVIVDDCSDDGSFEILKNYAKVDDRIRLFRNDVNLGIAKTLNSGLGLCSAELVARMDADDISLENRLEKQISFMRNNSGVALSGTQAVFVDENNRRQYEIVLPINHEVILKYLEFETSIFHPSFMFRKKAVIDICGYRNLQPIEDYDLLLRLIERGFRLANLPECLLRIRLDQAGISMKSKFVQNRMKEHVYRSHRERVQFGAEVTNLQEILQKLNETELSYLEYLANRMHIKAWTLRMQNKLPTALCHYFFSFVLSKYERESILKRLKFYFSRMVNFA